MASNKLRIEALEATVDTLQPKKRKKVRLDPNTKFASIEDIAGVAAEALEAENEVDIEEEVVISPNVRSNSRASSVVGDCIVVAVRGRQGRGAEAARMGGGPEQG